MAPEEESQTRAVVSQEAVATRRPSGLKATALTRPVCPESFRTGEPFPSKDQIHAELSKYPATMVRPSGLNAAQSTRAPPGSCSDVSGRRPPRTRMSKIQVFA